MQTAAPAPQVAQITYEEAMATLSSMFQHIPPPQLTAVLKANRWNMERTIEMLLQDGDAGATPLAPTPAAAPSSSSSSSSASQPGGGRRRGKPVKLPEDFLRIPGGSRHRSPVSAEDQLRLDEALARQLQAQDGVEARYQQHRRARSTSLQHRPQPPPQPSQQRRPRVASAPGYYPAAEKLGKALGEAGASVKKRVRELYAQFRNAKDGRHQQLEDHEDSEVVVFGSGSGVAQGHGQAAYGGTGGVLVSSSSTGGGGTTNPPPGPRAQQQGEGDDEEEEEEEEEEEILFSAGGGRSSAPQRMV